MIRRAASEVVTAMTRRIVGGSSIAASAAIGLRCTIRHNRISNWNGATGSFDTVDITMSMDPFGEKTRHRTPATTEALMKARKDVEAKKKGIKIANENLRVMIAALKCERNPIPSLKAIYDHCRSLTKSALEADIARQKDDIKKKNGELDRASIGESAQWIDRASDHHLESLR